MGELEKSVPDALTDTVDGQGWVAELRSFTDTAPIIPSEAIFRRRAILSGIVLALACLAIVWAIFFHGEVTEIGSWSADRLLLTLLAVVVAVWAALDIRHQLHLRRSVSFLTKGHGLSSHLPRRLLATAKAMNRLEELDKVLETILSCARDLLDGRDGSIQLLQGKDELRSVCVSGTSGAHNARLRFGEGIAGRVAASREPLLIVGTIDFAGRRLPPEAPPPPASAMSVPLLHRGKLLGVLNINAVPERTYDRHDLRALKLFGEQAAVAIANARLYETQRLLASQKSYQALHDALTNLPNRALFLDRVEQALRRRRPQDQLLALLFLDLDDFKAVNDCLGHAAGDLLLKAVASSLRSLLRSGDTVARFGGDEFALLMENIRSLDEAKQAAERISAGLVTPIDLDGHEVNVRASIGLVVETPGLSTPAELLRQAGAAMYVAKGEGKHSVVVFEESMRGPVVERTSLETRLRHDFANERLEVHFQPILRLDNQEVVGIEALVRWPDPERGLLPAAALLPFAEQGGLLAAIDRWVLRQACLQVQRLDPDLRPSGRFSLHVNISRQRLLQPFLVDEIDQLLAETALVPNQVTLEITESAVLGDSGVVAQHLGGLKALGLQIAIDDFGTGYASFIHLRSLPVDVVKIDPVLVDGLIKDTGAVSLVQGILRWRQSMNLEVIAEGIEHEEQREKLIELGCLTGQGFLLCEPLSGPDLNVFLRRHAQARAVVESV